MHAGSATVVAAVGKPAPSLENARCTEKGLPKSTNVPVDNTKRVEVHIIHSSKPGLWRKVLPHAAGATQLPMAMLLRHNCYAFGCDNLQAHLSLMLCCWPHRCIAKLQGCTTLVPRSDVGQLACCSNKVQRHSTADVRHVHASIAMTTWAGYWSGSNIPTMPDPAACRNRVT